MTPGTNGPGDAPPDPRPPDIWSDALLAARLCAVDPGLGGLVLRGGGEARDAVVAALIGGLRPGAPVRRVPSHIDDERLLGGIDLGATLSTGRPVSRAGLLAEADGGALVLPMAERLAETTAAAIAAALDTGEVIAERDGMTLRLPARFAVVALDDGIEIDDRPPVALAERLAFWFDLSVSAPPKTVRPELVAGEAGLIFDPTPDILEAIAATTLALGIDSARAPIFALRAARACAMLAGRRSITEADVMVAARARARSARYAPAAAAGGAGGRRAGAAAAAARFRRQRPGKRRSAADRGHRAGGGTGLAPQDVFDAIAAGGGRRLPKGRGQGKGARQRSATRGRPVGVRAGIPRGGLRLSLIDTLRAAAPWQRMRGAEAGRVQVRLDDLRIRRFEKKMEATTIFAVDASGSSALARLAEAKGAVELLLAEAYVKRAQVALIAFRGTTAELILPPTRSLARARNRWRRCREGAGRRSPPG